MEVKVEKLKKSKVKLNISLSPKEMIKHFNAAYTRLAPSVKLDGFRPGKAPRTLIESSIGVTKIVSEALDLAINESYIKALQENKINPFTQPNLKINKYPTYGTTEEEVANNFEYEMEFATYPEVEIGDYSKVKIEKPKKEAAKDEDVQKIIDNLLKQKANFKEVEREAKKGDFVELSFEGSLKGVRIDAMCSKNHPLVLGENSLIPGFEDEVVGMKKGEKKTFKIKFPKDYHSKEYAGKEAEFAVELLNLKEVVLPELDDAFAAGFGEKNAESLKAAILKNLELELEHKAQEEFESKVIDKVVPFVKSDLPDEIIDKEVERMIEGYKKQLTGMGLQFEQYLKSTNKSVDDLKKDMRPTAEKNVKVGLMLGKIIDEQKFDGHDPEAGKKAINFLVEQVTKK
jgi:trigger factor